MEPLKTDETNLFLKTDETALPGEIVFSNSSHWVMRITSEGRIEFNREGYPEFTPDDFAKAVIDILEKSLVRIPNAK